MRLISTLVIVFSTSVICNFAFGQSSTSSKYVERFPARLQFALKNGHNNIKMSGFEPGQTYSIHAIQPKELEDKIGFALQFGNDCRIISSPKKVSNDNKSITAEIIPTSDTVSLVVEVTDMGQEEVLVWISMNCLTCVPNKQWKDEFLAKGAAMLGITTATGASPTTLVSGTLIGGNCFDVTGATASGPATNRGTFAAGTSSISLETGVVLASGPISDLPGPNVSPSTGFGFGNGGNDPNLATLSSGNQADITKLEFDFRPTSNTVSFDFVFGSEEYCEFANSTYNDAFGFFISGPGIAGTQNIALLPASTTPVTINSVNHVNNTVYYRNNNTFSSCGPAVAPNFCELDGFTSVLTATANVIPCQVYHIKLAICDISDALYTSAVFLKANSFDAGNTVKADPIYPITTPSFVYEGCGNGFFQFTRLGDLTQAMTFTFTINPASTATLGVDYLPFPLTITIPAGQTQFLLPITVLSDGLAEGLETIIISLENPCACSQLNSTFNIVDVIPVQATLANQSLCGNNSVNLTPTLTGGQAPFQYNWSTGAVTSAISINTPGTNTYMVTVTDACMNASTASALVSITPGPIAILTGGGTICAGQSGNINLTLTLSGAGPWDVVFNNNGTSQPMSFFTSPATIPVNSSGTYSITSVVSNGCPGNPSGNVTVQAQNVNIFLATTSPGCAGGNPTITASATGATTYSYLWNNGSMSNQQLNVSAGTYTVTVTGNNGCTSSATTTVTGGPPMLVSIAPPQNITCLNPSQVVSVIITGGSPGFTYNWTGGLAGANPSVSTANTYTVTVTDLNNCTSSATVTISGSSAPPIAFVTPPAALGCTVATVNLSGLGSSTGGNFTYQWSPAANVTSGQGTLSPTVNQGGNYTLLVTNTSNGCTAQAFASVVQNSAPPIAQIAAPLPIACGNVTPTLNASGSSTGANIAYTWTTTNGVFVGGQNTINPTVSAAGTYTLLVTNSNTGCTSTTSVTITGNTAPPIATIAPPGIINCSTTSIFLSGSNGGIGTYQWSGPGIISGWTSATPTVNLGGTYNLIVTNPANNCTSIASVTVGVNNSVPIALIAPAPALGCVTSSVSLNGSGSSNGGNFTYQWSPAANVTSGQGTLSPTVNQGGNYTLLVTNTSNGCTAQAFVSVVQNSIPPIAQIAAPAPISCGNATPTLNASSSSTGANISYAWTTTNGVFVGGQNTINPTVSSAGTYTLLVTNSNSGCTSIASVTITGNTTPPLANIVPPLQFNCQNNTITLNGAGSSTGSNISYLWTTTNGFIVSGASTLQSNITLAGTYSLSVSNTSNGCSNFANVTVTGNSTPPIAAIQPPGQLGCQTTQLTLSSTGSSSGANFSYEWTTNNGNIVSGNTSPSPVINFAGTYTLLITNAINMCTATASVTVTAGQAIPLAIANTPGQLSCNTTNLTLSGIGSSTGTNYSYIWNTTNGNIISGGTTLSPVINATGDYQLTVLNAQNGCSNTATISIINNNIPPTASIATPGLISCTNSTLTLSGSGGTGVTYQWSSTIGGNIVSVGTTASLVVSAAGTYTMIVTNASNGCTASQIVTVNENNDTPSVSIAPAAALTCAQSTTQLSAIVNGAGNYTLLWTTQNGALVSGINTSTPTVGNSGSYLLVATNPISGCTASATVSVSEDINIPNAQIIAPEPLNCTTPVITLNGGASSTGAGYTLSWSTSGGAQISSGANTLTPVTNAAGTYTLTILNTNNNCSATATVVVTNNSIAPTADAGQNATLICGVSSLNLSGSGSGQGATIHYVWTTANGLILSGGNTTAPTISAPGTYQLQVTDPINGCTAIATVEVAQDNNAPTVLASTTGTITCSINQLVLSGAGSSSGIGITYAWSTSDGNIVSGGSTLSPTINAAGTYQLEVTNTVNGCSTIGTVIVSEEITQPNISAGADLELTCAINTLALGGNSTDNVSYAWVATNGGNINSGTNTPNPQVTSAGTYSLTVTSLANGCTATDIVLVTQSAQSPQVIISTPENLNCQTLNVTLDGSGSDQGSNFSYQWSGPSIISGQGTLSPIVTQSGNYTLFVTNNTNGCSATTAIDVQSNTQVPTADAGQSATLICGVSSVNLSGSGSGQGATVDYLWTTANGLISSGENTTAPTISAPGTYQLQVTDPINGCTVISTVEVLQDNNAPTAQAATPGILTCAINQLVLSGAGSSSGAGITYAWSTSDGNIVSGGSTLSPTINAIGTYQLEVTNTVNGCSTIGTVIVSEEITQPNISAGADLELTCATNTLVLGGSSTDNVSYAWAATNGGNINSGTNTPNPQVTSAGTYSLTVTSLANGCTATDIMLVTQSAQLPQVVIATPATLDCQTLNITLDGSGSDQGSNFSYQWSGPSIISGQGTLSPIVSQSGNYTLLVINNTNGCSATTVIDVISNTQAPTADAGQNAALLCGMSSVALSGSGSGQSITVEYAWTTTNGLINTGGTTTAPTVGAPGTYQLQVTDPINGCTAISLVEVLQDNNAPTVVVSNPTSLSCITFEVTLNASGTSTGTNFTYQWSTSTGNIVSGGTTLSPLVNAEGTYQLLVTNTANSCTAVNAVAVISNTEQPIAEAGAATNLTCEVSEIMLQGSGTASTTNLSYQWTATNGGNIISGGNTSNPLINATGTYTLLVTNNNDGCTDTDAVVITSTTAIPLAVIANPQTINCLQSSITLDATASSQGNDYVLAWSGQGITSGAGTLFPTVNQPGIYTLTITNTTNSCSKTTTVTVSQDTTIPTANAGSNLNLVCGESDGELFGDGSSTGANFSYYWSTSSGNIVGGANTFTIEISAAGTYQLLVTNTENGCTSTDQTNVVINLSVPSATIQQKAPDCSGDLGFITFKNVQGGTPPYNFSIDGGQSYVPTADFNSLGAGTYTVLVSDANGCLYAIDTLQFAPILLPELSTLQDIYLAYGQKDTLVAQTNLSLSQIDTVIWSPLTYLTPLPNPLKMLVAPSENTQYKVKIVSISGCEDEALVRVYVDVPGVWAPNVISPNSGTGPNKNFTIFSADNTIVSIERLEIFDRWGTNIFVNSNFDANQPALGWNGKTKDGKELNPAVFVWWARIVLIDGSKLVIKGDITLTE